MLFYFLTEFITVISMFVYLENKKGIFLTLRTLILQHFHFLVYRPGECPALPDDSIDACVDQCSYDLECPSTTKCCSNGCGHTCVPLFLLSTCIHFVA